MNPSRLEDGALRDLAKLVIGAERAGIDVLAGALEQAEFTSAVRLLASCEGRILVCGVGKSGLVAQRISASFRSTGTPSVFLHPVEALHGDLGLVAPDDVGLFLSKSGRSEELLRLLPIFKRIPIPFVAVVFQADSDLARQSDVALCLGRVEEAGPLKLVPTTTNTIFDILGDILVTCLYSARGTTEADLAFLHPGGVIGTQVTIRVGELMHTGSSLPRVEEGTRFREAIVEMMEKKLGMTTVVDNQGRLIGILTDGDVRRIVYRHDRIDTLEVGEIMTRAPRTISKDDYVARAVEQMENNSSGPITSLVVVDGEGRPEGVLHLHDCLRARKRP